jgi:hypothetical protein
MLVFYQYTDLFSGYLCSKVFIQLDGVLYVMSYKHNTLESFRNQNDNLKK